MEITCSHSGKRLQLADDKVPARPFAIGCPGCRQKIRVDPTAPAPTSGSDQLLDGMMDMMIAQRMFMANLRAAQAADEMLESAIEIGD